MSSILFRSARGKWGKRLGATLGILVVLSMVLVYIAPFLGL